MNATGCDQTASGRRNTATAATAPPTASMLAGVSYATIEVGDARYAVGVAGAGAPVLLLHGFPQDHTCWQRVAPALARDHAVVVCDLKGCGASTAPRGGPHGEGYSAREIAAEFIYVMARLGHERFAVIGHDRGARVAYRMALDHPDRITHLGVLNVIPTVEQFERMTADTALEYWPFLLLAQPPPFAEQLIATDADARRAPPAQNRASDPAAIEPDAAARYTRAFTPATIAAWCAEYRAAFHLDRALDAHDRTDQRTITCPVLVHWGADEHATADGPLPIWHRWARNVRGGPLPGGHFIPEEAATELTASLRAFLAP